MAFGRSVTRTSGPVAAVLLGAAALGAATGAAPSAQRATGAVAEAVERALDSGAGSFDHSAEHVFVAASLVPQPDSEEELGFVARLVTWLRDTAAGLGWLGPFFYGLVYALAVVLFVPGSALTIAAGITFGLGLGTLTVFVGANIGAALSFLIARYVLRDRVEKLLAGRPALRAIDRAVETQGWRIVFLTRLSPVFPFSAQNCFYGLTGVTFYQYVAASLVGMLPGTILYVYIGAAGAEVAEASGGAASWGQTTLLVAGLLATAAVVVLVTRVARRELEKALAEVETETAPDSTAP
ncbi:TVP38/TMEM64 family protein [Candidatus Palauibacter sp.]|uniref:TVP38/TMEM64 family protein n=1 Tax=Candidatus Palauibacter sp. TaxID=3101350 RepID=UPI003AF26A20